MQLSSRARPTRGITIIELLVVLSVIAILAGVPAFEGLNDAVAKWADVHNPFFNGPYSDALTLIPFAALCVYLYLVGNGTLLGNGSAGAVYAGIATDEGEPPKPPGWRSTPGGE